MKLCKLMSAVRPIGPVALGIFLGFAISFLSVSWMGEPCNTDGKLDIDVMLTEEGNLKGARKPNSISISNSENGENEEDFVPKIVPYIQARQSEPKKLFRAKYISTELGIRDRLFVGVLTSKDTIGTLGVAVNRTISHHLDTVVFFTSTRSRKVPHGMTVVTHGDERLRWSMFQTITYIMEHFLDKYDWFYFVQDDTYTEADRLKDLIGHLSINHQLYMGHPKELIGGETTGRYCYGGYGYLLSRLLLLQLRPFLDNCRNDILSARPDEWLGRCIIDHTKTSCVDEHEGLDFYHFEMGKHLDLSTEDNFHLKDAITVHPVLDAELMYRLHKLFTELELQKTYGEIEKLQAEIKNVSELAFEGNRSSHWPVGIHPPFEPKTRFEVLRWDYFTEDQMLYCVDGSPKCDLHGIDKMDIADVIDTAVVELNRKYSPVLHLKKQHLVNGYRRFDPTRGMEYTLDLQLEVINQNGRSCSITRRVHLVRPLSQVEIIPMPYVTEASRVYVIVPVTVHDREHINQFLKTYSANSFEKTENAVLTILFIYDSKEAEQLDQNDVFGNVKEKIDTYEKKYSRVKIPWISVKTESPSPIKIMDIISKKHPADTLFFFASVNTDVNSEFLNRCRLNAINNWQVFFPIHFQGYNPDVAYHNQQPPPAIDLVRDAGFFDRGVFDEACFYNSDYMAARMHLASSMQENEELLETLDLYDIFVKHSSLHVLRAVEPALLRRYWHQLCNPRLGANIYHRCAQSMLDRLGSRSQLSMLLFETEQGNST